jgi:positive regulator of sigma E activity
LAVIWQRKNKVHDRSATPSDTERGIITAIIGNEAIIELAAQESCESCGAKMICLPDANGKRKLRALNPHQAKVGSQVTISEKSNFLLLVSFLQYGVPLLFFLLFIFIFYLGDLKLWSLPRELVWFATGLIGIFCGALLSRFFIARLAVSNRSFFEVSEIIN